jgi:NAD(P)-dependent dehydrogenase (short-subunit alcohol dehydrogenase family)
MADASTVVITGATGGIGLYSAIGIARTGARVIITGRDHDRGESARRRVVDESRNSDVELVVGSVSSLAAIDAMAHKLLEASRGRIDVLINNAGYFGDTRLLSDDGLEMHFAVNVVSPWRLTHALLPALKAGGGARVLNITAGDPAPGTPVALDVDDLQAEKGFKGMFTMARSKSAMEAASMALAQKLEPEKVAVNVIWPGRASTAMTRSVSLKSLPGALKLFYPCMKLMFKDDGGKGAEKAARAHICLGLNEPRAGRRVGEILRFENERAQDATKGDGSGSAGAHRCGNRSGHLSTWSKRLDYASTTS